MTLFSHSKTPHPTPHAVTNLGQIRVRSTSLEHDVVIPPHPTPPRKTENIKNKWHKIGGVLAAASQLLPASEWFTFSADFPCYTSGLVWLEEKEEEKKEDKAEEL